MERTFSYRRQEVVQDKPLVADFKSRWPALFEMSEINREFMRITTVPLTSKFLSQLDECSDQLVKVFINKGGAAGKEIRSTIAVMDRSDDIEVRRECILKCLCTYLHEDSGKLVRGVFETQGLAWGVWGESTECTEPLAATRGGRHRGRRRFYSLDKDIRNIIQRTKASTRRSNIDQVNLQ
ncbi:hypothetical protein JOQ06_029217, partial [Pogonophryne albipinna]